MQQHHLIVAILVILRHDIGVRTSHYRGSMISWRIVNSTVTTATVEILQRHAWHYYTAQCNRTQIAAGNFNIGSGNLRCATPCPANISVLAPIAVPCTDFNIAENYTNGEGRRQIVLPINRTITGFFEGSTWFVLVQGGGNWSIAVQINTARRPDGRFNQAPIVTMLPIIRLRRNLTHNIRINVADNDFDPYQCYWSTTWMECGGICRQLPNNTVLNSTSCMLRFTPPRVGYYAVALTIVDFESTTSVTQLSRVPIQFIFNIWDSNNTCSTPPIYLGDVPADQCIYIEPGQTEIRRVLMRVRCPNATLDNIITSSPPGFIRSPTFVDPTDPTVYGFMFTYTARVEQIGQNLFCFAGVDSIGNQADTTCLRFTVQFGTSSMNTLYINNATRFPMGTVNKSQSIWTLMYPIGTTFTRPTVRAYVRFKIASSQAQFFDIDVTKNDSVSYEMDRLVINTTGYIFTPGESFFISLDPGVFIPAWTCSRDSMGITDPTFWTFNVPWEPNPTTLTTIKTTITKTTTPLSRTRPTLKTIAPTTSKSTTSPALSTLPNIFVAMVTATRLITPKKEVPVSGIVGIVLGIITIGSLIGVLLYVLRHGFLKQPPAPSSSTQVVQKLNEPKPQYRIATRSNPYRITTSACAHEETLDTSLAHSDKYEERTFIHLIDIDC